jgi:hypothetical protein
MYCMLYDTLVRCVALEKFYGVWFDLRVFYLFYYDLFNAIANGSDYIVSNNR